MNRKLKMVEFILPAEKIKKQKKDILIAIFVSFVAGFISYLSYDWFIYQKNNIETNNAYIETNVFHVQSRMMGYVKKVKTQEQQKVSIDEELIQLDLTDIELEKKIKETKYQKASIDLRRAKKLYSAQMLSQADFENAEALLKLAEADLELSKLKEKYSVVKSPSIGFVAKIHVKEGQFIQPGQTLFTIVENENFWIKANYKETQISSIRNGQTATVQIDAYPGIHFKGKVVGIYPSSGGVTSLIPSENATGNFTKVVQRVPIKISIEKNEKYVFRPGMSAVTTIQLLDQE